jgi:rhodanese-related sulfurtransferase
MAAERVDVGTAHEMWKLGDIFLDVREPDEYARGHVAGAINVPIDALPGRIGDLPDGQIITLCSGGGRAGRAAQRLDTLGRVALALAGGTKAWAAAGLPIVTGPAPGHRRG